MNTSISTGKTNSGRPGVWGRILSALLLTLFLYLLLVPAAWGYPAVTVLVNGAKISMDVLPVIEDGRTLVPVRAIGEALGATVGWEQASRKVTIQNGNDTILLYIDSANASVSGVSKQLDVPARIIGGRTLIPLRFVSENFGATVSWEQSSYTATITTGGQSQPGDETTAALETELLSLLNQARQKLNYQPVIQLDILNTMAGSHSADMAKDNFFGHNSPSYGSQAQRAAAKGLPACYEFLAYGYPYAQKILDAWLSSSEGAALLAENTRFVGFGLSRGSKNSIDDLYAVAEAFGGAGVMQGARERTVTDANISLSGWLAEASAPLTIYKMNGSGSYESRQSFYLSANGSNGAFTFSFQLWGAGDYRILLGDDSITVHYSGE